MYTEVLVLFVEDVSVVILKASVMKILSFVSVFGMITLLFTDSFPLSNDSMVIVKIVPDFDSLGTEVSKEGVLLYFVSHPVKDTLLEVRCSECDVIICNVNDELLNGDGTSVILWSTVSVWSDFSLEVVLVFPLVISETDSSTEENLESVMLVSCTLVLWILVVYVGLSDIIMLEENMVFKFETVEVLVVRFKVVEESIDGNGNEIVL